MQEQTAKGMRVFFLVWLSQTVSLVGTGLTTFALGVWVYRQTGSVTQFTMTAFASALPALIVAPLAGALIDRWDRRWAMILSDSGSGLGMLTIALLHLTGHLHVWHVYIVVAASALFEVFQWPAYTAATTLLVPKQHYGRASGMVQTSYSLSQLVAPVLGGVLYAAIDLNGVLLVDFATFVLSVATLLFLRFPRPKPSGIERKPVWREALDGLVYLRERKGLVALLLLFTLANFLMALITVLATPMVLSFTTAKVLGAVLSIGGSGMLFGSVLMSVWGGPKHRVLGMLAFEALAGFSAILAGARPSVVLITAAAFLYFFCTPMVNGCAQAIWQSKVDPGFQGRIFAVRRMVGWSARPLAFLLAGPICDRLLEPMMRPGGALAGTLGPLIGTGPGRGIALMFILSGTLTILAMAAGYRYPYLRRLEADLPDAVDDPQPAPAIAEARLQEAVAE